MELLWVLSASHEVYGLQRINGVPLHRIGRITERRNRRVNEGVTHSWSYVFEPTLLHVYRFFKVQLGTPRRWSFSDY